MDWELIQSAGISYFFIYFSAYGNEDNNISPVCDHTSGSDSCPNPNPNIKGNACQVIRRTNRGNLSLQPLALQRDRTYTLKEAFSGIEKSGTGRQLASINVKLAPLDVQVWSVKQ